MSLKIEYPSEIKPHWKEDQTNDDYHADKTAVSSTSLKRILKSPKSFYSSFTEPNKQTKAMQFGSAVHAAILEPDSFRKRYVKAKRFTGVGAVAAQAEWRLSLPTDAIIMSDEEYEQLEEMLFSVLGHPDACNILKNGIAERSGYFVDPETQIKCKIKPDFYHPGLNALLDVKTTQSIEKDEFSKSIWNYRYDFQMAMYCLGIEIITGNKVEFPLFLAIEKNPPYECGVYMADSLMLHKGLEDYKRAMFLLKENLISGEWSPYQKRNELISLPAWALKEFAQ